MQAERYPCGCEVRGDGVVEPCQEAKKIFDEEGTQEKLDEHYDSQEYVVLYVLPHA